MGNFCKFFGALACVLVPCAVLAQEPPATGGAQEGGGGRGGRAQEPEIRPYDRVITKEAKSDDGVFTVHRIKDRIYYEIRRSELGSEFLWVSQIAKTTLGAGYGGQAAGNRVVKWERRGDRILLRAVSYDVVADPATPIAKAVEAANYNPIIMAFNIEALGKDDAAVIDVTRLFTTDVPEFSGRTRVGRAASTRRARSSSAPCRSPRTSKSKRPTPTTTRHRRRRPAAAAPHRRLAAAARRRSAPAAHSVVMHYSMVMLPEKPMMPRLFDERVGYFSTAHDRLRQGRASRAAAPLHHALAAREEGPERGDLRAGQADRLLHRSGDADEVGAVPEEGHRELAAGVRSGRLQERDHREGSADARARIPTGARRTRATR